MTVGDALARFPWALKVETHDPSLAEERWHVAKKDWAPGPWHDEPDKVEWREPTTGAPCLMIRGPQGAWCGYVAVEPGHRLHGVEFGEIHDELNVALTYSAGCDGGHICHVPLPGESHDAWWLGFDCGHAFDRMPAMEASMNRVAAIREMNEAHERVRREFGFPGDHYHTLEEVRADTEELARLIHGTQPQPQPQGAA